MAKYAPGTLDDQANIERSFRKRSRLTFSTTTPTSSQILGTNYTVLEEFPEVKQNAKDALKKAEEALEKAGTSYKFVDITDAEIEAMFEEE